MKKFFDTNESRNSRGIQSLMSLLLAFGTVAACSSGPAEEGITSDGDSAGSTGKLPEGSVASGGGGTCMDEENPATCKKACMPRSDQDPPNSVCIQRVEGRLVDEFTKPISNLTLSVCGESCYLGKSDDNGNFSIPVYAWHIPGEYALNPHGTPHLTTFFFQLEPAFAGGVTYDAGDLRLFELPSDGDLLVVDTILEDNDVSPQQQATSGVVTVTVGKGTRVVLDFEDVLEGDEGRRFRALEVDKKLQAEFAPQFDSRARVFALGPFDAGFVSEVKDANISVSLQVKNTESWAGGSEVKVFALGTTSDDSWITPFTFGEVGTAMVSADGTSIDLPAETPGGGLERLTWLVLQPQD